MDFSPDGKRLLVMKYVSANESYPGVVDLATRQARAVPGRRRQGRVRRLRVRAGRQVGVLRLRRAAGRQAAANSSTLRHHDPASGKFDVLSATSRGTSTASSIADDGKHLAYVTNEDGIGKLHVLSLPGHQRGDAAGAAGRRDRRLRLLARRQAPGADAQHRDLAQRRLRRSTWRDGEAHALDAERSRRPGRREVRRADAGALSRPSTRSTASRARSRRSTTSPANVPAGKKLPVVINIHGGPEGQALPTFNPTAQFLANELGVAVLVPNVRGSSGYGKTYLQLDNAEKREDSVKDIGALLDWIAQQPELDAVARRRARRQLRRLHGAGLADALRRPHPRRRRHRRHLALRHLPQEHRELPPRPAPRRVRRRARPGDAGGVRRDLAAQQRRRRSPRRCSSRRARTTRACRTPRPSRS